MKIDIPTLRILAENDRIAFKKHSILRMNQREISVDEVRDVFMQGEIIELYPEARPLPCCLMLGFGTEGNPLHVVVAVDDSERMLWVITVYRPLKEEWDETYKRRKPS